jgi:prefoldin subunit 5
VSEAEVQRVIGRLEAQVTSLGNALAHLTNKIDTLDAKIDAVEKTLSEARGGWRILMLIAGAAGSVGAALSYLASYIHLPKP